MTDSELINEIEAQKALMITVATGGPRIDSVNGDYVERRRRIADELARRRIEDLNPHTDLWRWHGKWSSGDLPSYASRRMYVADLYDPLLERVRRSGVGVGSDLFDVPTGWAKVDRQIDGVRSALETARSEEDYQGVGHRCREAIISLGQAVYRPDVHPSPDGVRPSATDAKRMLEGYLANEHAGDSNADTRKLVRAAFDLANTVQHRRTATFRDAALCAEATITVINTIAILAGRRDDVPREETAVETVQRRERESDRRRQHETWLRSAEAHAAAVTESEAVAAGLIARIDAMKGANGFRHRKVGRLTIAESPDAALSVCWKEPGEFDLPLGHLAVSEYDGLVNFGRASSDEGEVGEYLGTWRYTFDRDETGRPGWRYAEGEREFCTSDELLEGHLKHALKLLDRG